MFVGNTALIYQISQHTLRLHQGKEKTVGQRKLTLISRKAENTTGLSEGYNVVRPQHMTSSPRKACCSESWPLLSKMKLPNTHYAQV